MTRYDDEEYIEQDEAERETAGRRKSVIALAVIAVLVVAGLYLVGRLREVSAVQDCLMTGSSNCNDLVRPPVPASNR